MFCLKYEATCLMKSWKCLLVYFTHKGHKMFTFERIISQVTIAPLQAFPCSQDFCTTPLPSWPSCFTFFQQGVVMIIHYVAHMTNCQCTLVFKNEVLLHFVYSCYSLSFQHVHICKFGEFWEQFKPLKVFIMWRHVGSQCFHLQNGFWWNTIHWWFKCLMNM
jgi:hypothetical protein